jgi:hypothetical protein
MLSLPLFSETFIPWNFLILSSAFIAIVIFYWMLSLISHSCFVNSYSTWIDRVGTPKCNCISDPNTLPGLTLRSFYLVVFVLVWFYKWAYKFCSINPIFMTCQWTAEGNLISYIFFSNIHTIMTLQKRIIRTTYSCVKKIVLLTQYFVRF